MHYYFCPVVKSIRIYKSGVQPFYTIYVVDLMENNHICIIGYIIQLNTHSFILYVLMNTLIQQVPNKPHVVGGKKSVKLNTNIDLHHRQLVNTYATAIQFEIPRLKRERDLLRAENRQQSTSAAVCASNTHRIKCIRLQIAKIESDYREYMSVSARSVFHFYEEKQQMASGNNAINRNSMSDFFNMASVDNNDSDSHTQSGLCSDTLYRQYWKNVNGNITHASDFIMDTTTCVSCGTGELIPQEEDGILVCNNMLCGKYISHIIDNQKATHCEVQNEVYYTAYNRLNHFKEILSQFQAKQTTTIPQHIIDKIAARMTKERMSKNDICYSQMRHILTVLELSKYFEHIQHINAIFGVRPPMMDAELHDTLCVLFLEIQTPWSMCCPASRVNFFNYTYVLYQLFILLDQKQFLRYTSVASDRVMKDRVKQMEQDNVWKEVCKKLDWVFYPTV